MCNRGGFATFPTSSALYTYDFQLFRQIKGGILAKTARGDSDELRLGGL
jgi:hypothetical protein